MFVLRPLSPWAFLSIALTADQVLADSVTLLRAIWHFNMQLQVKEFKGKGIFFTRIISDTTGGGLEKLIWSWWGVDVYDWSV